MKYFQIGKDFITKKLENFEHKPVLDYATEQIPGRIRQSLSVLQREEIDIEDGQPYENYFKSYPNHHLSHFLLDKYNMMIEGEAEASQYIPPAGPESHIPTFDDKLEHKALLLREAIQQYDEGYSKNEEPILCICVINFHHKRGTEIEYRYPQQKSIESLDHLLVHHAMPDSSHNKSEDYNFFNFQTELKGKKRMLFGVSYFKQIKLTEQMRKQNADFTRSYLQKAVAILSTVPLFGYLKVKLSITTKVFFEKFTNFGIIEEAFKDISKHLTESWPTMPITDLYIGSDLKAIIPLFTPQDFYEIWKAVLYQKRIVVFGHSSSSVSSFILSLLSLFPGLSTFGIFSKPIAKYMQALRQLALPLRLFSSQNFLSISFHIQDFHLLDRFKKSKDGNFLIGTTNRLLKQTNDYGIQLMVNLENCSIQKRQSRKPWEPLSKKERKFLVELEAIVGRQKSIAYDSSEDCIRNHFHDFLKHALSEIIVGIRAFEKFTKECKQFAIQVTSPQNINKPESELKLFPPLFPEQTKKIIFPELLQHKSFAHFRQFKNESYPEVAKGVIIPSLFISNYNYYLRLSNDQFINYNWLEKKLSFGKGDNLKNFEGKEIRFKSTKDVEGKQLTKSIFVGRIQNGRFEKSGLYLDQFERYEGQYNHGIKEGYGKLENGVEKYIGDFVNGAYDGEGQLINKEDIYVGHFKNGAKNGYGTMQGSYKFEGLWDNNYPTISSEQLKAKQKAEQAKETSVNQVNKPKQGQKLLQQESSKQKQDEEDQIVVVEQENKTKKEQKVKQQEQREKEKLKKPETNQTSNNQQIPIEKDAKEKEDNPKQEEENKEEDKEQDKEQKEEGQNKQDEGDS